MFVCGRVHPWPLPPRTLWALDTVGRLDEQQYFTSLNLGYQNIPPEQSGSWDSLFFPISKWWSFTNLKKSKYHDRSLRTRTVACHLSLNCEQIYTDHSWTIEDEDPHLDTTWLVVPWNAGNKYSCAQWVQYMKKTDLGNITNYHMVQPSTSSQKISHCSVISLYLMNVYYTVHIYIYSPNPIKNNKKNHLPTSPCNSHFPTAVSPWGALMQSIKGIPLHLGIGAITPVKASDIAGISGCLRWLECVQSHFGEPFKQPKMVNEFLFLSDHCNSIAVNSMLQW